MYSSKTSNPSQLIDIPPNAEAKQAFLLIQQNFDTVWRMFVQAQRDILNLQEKIKKLGG